MFIARGSKGRVAAQANGESLQAAFDAAIREGFEPVTIEEPSGKVRKLKNETVASAVYETKPVRVWVLRQISADGKVNRELARFTYFGDVHRWEVEQGWRYENVFRTTVYETRKVRTGEYYQSLFDALWTASGEV